jgi:hypothetical protein
MGSEVKGGILSHLPKRSQFFRQSSGMVRRWYLQTSRLEDDKNLIHFPLWKEVRWRTIRLVEIGGFGGELSEG